MNIYTILNYINVNRNSNKLERKNYNTHIPKTKIH